jgi:hypothetical protein
MDAKFTILTNSTKGVIEYKMVRKLFSIKIKYSYSSTIPNEESVRFDAFYAQNIFSFFLIKLVIQEQYGMNTTIKKKDATNYLTES